MKIFFMLAIVGALIMQITIAEASSFPSRPIRIIVPSTVGSGQDIVTRALVPSLEKELGVNVAVINIGGGGGTLGLTEVSRAEPNGYTIGYLSVGPLSLQPQLRELPYTVASFKPVACVMNTPMVFMVRIDSPMNNLADAKKFLLEKDGKSAFGSPGPGGMTHIASIALIDAMGAKAKHIPDVGGAQCIKNMAGNFIQFYADGISFLNMYDVKALGVFSDKRDPDFPDIPTMKEQGYDLEFSLWGGIFVPKDTPDAIVAKLEQAVRTAVQSTAFKKAAKKSGITIQDMGSAEFSKFIEHRIAVDKELIEKFDIKQE